MYLFGNQSFTKIRIYNVIEFKICFIFSQKLKNKFSFIRVMILLSRKYLLF